MEKFRYTVPSGQGRPHYLVAIDGGAETDRFPFYDTLEIGRKEGSRPDSTGLLLVADAAVSFRHCAITHRLDGRCFIRDLSRNGTRLNGRRIVPNVETQIEPGEVIEIGSACRFVVAQEWQARTDVEMLSKGRTEQASDLTAATVLVGDIRDYTGLVRRAPAVELQRSVGRVFEMLNDEVVRLGGTVKEYQGDAIFAFWEGRLGGQQTVDACRAALVLAQTAERLAVDPSVWQLGSFPLKMDWAVATGVVVIDTIGASLRAGLSMIGEPVVLAFRLEKLANNATGHILTCGTTRALAAHAFAFRDLGEMDVQGFDTPTRVFALESALPD
jgi:class 3 adenylate cyclase